MHNHSNQDPGLWPACDSKEIYQRMHDSSAISARPGAALVTTTGGASSTEHNNESMLFLSEENSVLLAASAIDLSHHDSIQPLRASLSQDLSLATINGASVRESSSTTLSCSLGSHQLSTTSCSQSGSISTPFSPLPPASAIPFSLDDLKSPDLAQSNSIDTSLHDYDQAFSPSNHTATSEEDNLEDGDEDDISLGPTPLSQPESLEKKSLSEQQDSGHLPLHFSDASLSIGVVDEMQPLALPFVSPTPPQRKKKPAKRVMFDLPSPSAHSLEELYASDGSFGLEDMLLPQPSKLTSPSLSSNQGSSLSFQGNNMVMMGHQAFCDLDSAALGSLLYENSAQNKSEEQNFFRHTASLSDGSFQLEEQTEEEGAQDDDHLQKSFGKLSLEEDSTSAENDAQEDPREQLSRNQTIFTSVSVSELGEEEVDSSSPTSVFQFEAEDANVHNNKEPMFEAFPGEAQQDLSVPSLTPQR